MANITAATEDYIRKRASIKYCVKRGLVNYRSLAKHIAKDAGIKGVKIEGIAIAARRFREKIKHAESGEDILELFKNSNYTLRNNVVVFTIEKSVYPDALIDVEKAIKKEQGMFFSIEGTKSITLITDRPNAAEIRSRFKNYILEFKDSLSLITITAKGIGETPGAVFFITGLFYENSINIEEFMSCYDDTLIVIRSEDVPRVIEFLRF